MQIEPESWLVEFIPKQLRFLSIEKRYVCGKYHTEQHSSLFTKWFNVHHCKEIYNQMKDYGLSILQTVFLFLQT